MEIPTTHTHANKGDWDKESFHTLFNEYYPVICRYTYSIVNDIEQAKDISAELFCNLWQQRGHTSIHTNLKNYLLVSARRMANKHLHQLAKERNGNQEAQYFIDLTASNTANQYQQLVSRESRVKLDKILQKISPLRKEIIDLKLLGLNNKEIAVVMNLSYKKIEYQLKEAIRELQEEIKAVPELQAELVFLLVNLVLVLS